MNQSAPLLEMLGIEKSFSGIRALRGVSLTLAAGEVVALVGENGAGKSTLMKVLGGAYRPDAGTIRIDGREVSLRNPHEAHRAGIALIHQEFTLIPGLPAWENLFLGREIARFGWIARRAERRRARELFERLGVPLDLDAPCRALSVVQRQIVEIAKALARDARILVMDEPSATLTAPEVRRLLEVIRDLQRHGIGIIYISHRLEEVFKIADRIVVLRDGANVAQRPRADFTRGELIELMVGRPLADEFPKRCHAIGEARLVVHGLRRGQAVRAVSFQVRRGEVLGLTGLVGAGRTETARLIFGADVRETGEITLDGRPLTIRSPRDAIRAGIALLTEDRQRQGLVLAHSVQENFSLPNLNRLSRWNVVRRRAERADLKLAVEQMRIRISSPDQLAGQLSGGNQQKVVLAKWLARRCEVIIFDEPTRGIDVGAKYEIYALINRLAGEGKAIVLISSDLPEVLGMADRILVMHDGRITGAIADITQATQEKIMELAVK